MRIIALLLLFLPLPVLAAEDTLVRTISVIGEAKISVVPDRVHISASARARDMELGKAKLEHDKELQALLDLAKKYGVEGKYLSTDFSGIHPQYRWVNSSQQFEGYVVETSVRFVLKDLDDVGKFLVDLVQLKPEQVNGPNYALEDPKPLRDRTRIAALHDARAKAEALAAEAGLKVKKPISISENYAAAPQPMLRRQAMEMEAMSLSAEAIPAPPAGEKEINARIYVTYELVE